MNEIPDTQLRMAAMDMAVKYLNGHPEDKAHLVSFAKEIFEFVQGETK